MIEFLALVARTIDARIAQAGEDAYRSARRGEALDDPASQAEWAEDQARTCLEAAMAGGGLTHRAA